MSRAQTLRVDVRGPLELTVQLRRSDLPADEHDVRAVRLPGRAGSATSKFEVVLEGWRFEVSVEAVGHAELRERAARAAGDHRPASRASLRAQIPGRVTRVWVEAGEQVEQGQRLLAVEAMKMENEVRAPHAGRVDAIHVEVGSRVERDDPLVSLA